MPRPAPWRPIAPVAAATRSLSPTWTFEPGLQTAQTARRAQTAQGEAPRVPTVPMVATAPRRPGLNRRPCWWVRGGLVWKDERAAGERSRRRCFEGDAD